MTEASKQGFAELIIFSSLSDDPAPSKLNVMNYKKNNRKVSNVKVDS